MVCREHSEPWKLSDVCCNAIVRSDTTRIAQSVSPHVCVKNWFCTGSKLRDLLLRTSFDKIATCKSKPVKYLAKLKKCTSDSLKVWKSHREFLRWTINYKVSGDILGLQSARSNKIMTPMVVSHALGPVSSQQHYTTAEMTRWPDIKDAASGSGNFFSRQRWLQLVIHRDWDWLNNEKQNLNHVMSKQHGYWFYR